MARTKTMPKNAAPANATARAGKPDPKRDLKGAWKPGQSGNPAGKKPGTRHRVTMLTQALLEGQAEAVVKTVLAAAVKGDMVAARLIVERIVPPMRERPISAELPSGVRTAAEVSEALGAVLRATCDGEVLPSEAQILAGILEARRKSLETADLEARVAAIEGALK